MWIEALCFAVARDAVGAPSVRLELGDGATVAAAVAALAERHPALQPLLGSLRFAMDEEFVDGAERLHEGAILALIPPVSGG